MELLKDVGVPFGLSVTATKQNMNLLRKEEFYDHWFKEVGATYMWMFHLMPIGRARENIPLMISAEERYDPYSAQAPYFLFVL
jgi:MoaA/NifB/PqqE/SkfB family radical SAM enzyme